MCCRGVCRFWLALLVAALLEPVVLYLRRKFHFQRGFSALILTLTLLFLLGGLLSLLWSTLLSQTTRCSPRARVFRRDPAARTICSPDWSSSARRVPNGSAAICTSSFSGPSRTRTACCARCLRARWRGSALPPRRCRAACSPSRRACLRSSSPPRRTPSSARHSNTPCRKKRWQSCGSFAAA